MLLTPLLLDTDESPTGARHYLTPIGRLPSVTTVLAALPADTVAAFLAEPLPTDEAAFRQRIDEGRARLNLIAQEVARQAGAVLVEWAAAQRKLKDAGRFVFMTGGAYSESARAFLARSSMPKAGRSAAGFAGA